MNGDDEIMINNFMEICKRFERLHRLAYLGNKMHVIGIHRVEFKELLSLLVEAIKYNVGDIKLPLIDFLSWLEQNVDLLPDKSLSLSEIKDALPPDPIFPIVKTAREIGRELFAERLRFSPPPLPPTARELVDEFDALITGFSGELIRQTNILVTFFDVIKPESIPAIIKLIQKNPSNVRTSLGEPLCIWWLGRVLSEKNNVWRNTRGPIKYQNVEVDAISATVNNYCVGEVKITANRDQLSNGCDQLVLAAKHFNKIDHLRNIGYSWIATNCALKEIAVITLYNINNIKQDIKSYLETIAIQKGLKCDECNVYDIDDILDSINKWKSKSNIRYRELFSTLNKVIETT